MCDFSPEKMVLELLKFLILNNTFNNLASSISTSFWGNFNPVLY